MAGLGYKLFASGEVLTAANLQGYAVDQSNMVFASAAARTTALASPSQGMTAWLNDSGCAFQYLEAYNSSTNPAGASTAGWYPMSGQAVFMGTCGSFTTTNGVAADAGATSNLYTENIDPFGWHSTASNTQRIIPTIAGVYRISSNAIFASNATGVRGVNLYKNTVRAFSYSNSALGGGEATPTGGTLTISMNGTTDYFVASFVQTSGGNLAMTSVVTLVEFLKPLSV
jgi:hypothetical protein